MRLLEGYRGYVMIDYYAGYNALALQPGVERLACTAHAGVSSSKRRKCSPKARRGVPMINKQYGIE
ncbi:IS66 family transposase [Pseudomonas asiatica]|uniref:IS66 family transposase n=1 Tax=Pseudomonas asiatica TaxID=2219225 RepID=UPI0024482D15|nr:transposase [Pseudomonas asiatica]MDH0136209.1 IS66 family transposase [Pseudomonas asiatica]